MAKIEKPQEKSNRIYLADFRRMVNGGLNSKEITSFMKQKGYKNITEGDVRRMMVFVKTKEGGENENV